METVKLTIDNKHVEVPKGTTILQAAHQAGINIPSLCYMNLPHLAQEHKPGSCRVCVVEIPGRKILFPHAPLRVRMVWWCFPTHCVPLTPAGPLWNSCFQTIPKIV